VRSVNEPLFEKRRRIGRSLGAGIVGATLTIVLLVVGNHIAHWVIVGSGYTDLPGQDTLGLTLELEKYAIGLIALVAGRISGLLCHGARWLAAALAVSPLLTLFTISGSPFNRWYSYVLALLVALVGAYATDIQTGLMTRARVGRLEARDVHGG
jgi:hypothetical protein